MTANEVPSTEFRYQEIKKRIIQARKVELGTPAPVLIAVSKKQSIDAIESLYRLGHRDFGENYAQEMMEKAEELSRRGCSGIRWHFIGHLQTNKIKALLPYVHFVHTLDSEKLASKLAQRWTESGRNGKLPVFIEVNLDREPSKSGLNPEEVPQFAKRVAQFQELSLQGLMCIPSPDAEPKERFMMLRELEKSCRPDTQGMLSMGMSDDFEIAVQEGSTHVRVGTALFGARPTSNLQ